MSSHEKGRERSKIASAGRTLAAVLSLLCALAAASGVPPAASQATQDDAVSPDVARALELYSQDRPEAAFEILRAVPSAALQREDLRRLRVYLGQSAGEHPLVDEDLSWLLRRELGDANLWVARGSARLKSLRFDEAVSDFDQAIALEGDLMPQLWQRGIALYYAAENAACIEQFEAHRLVNPNDVENAVWHFLCMARQDGLDAARASMLPVGPDSRRTLPEIDALFRGRGSVEEVEGAVPAGDTAARFYADLYLGLYLEHFDDPRAVDYLERAAASPIRGYMVDVARVHVSRGDARGSSQPP